MSAIYSERSCPIGGSVDKRRIFRQRFHGLSGVQLLDGYDVVVCENCGLAFADGIPDQNAFDSYYELASKYQYGHAGGRESALDERRFREIARMISGCPAQDTRIPEIGCSTGRLLAVLWESGFTDVRGLDPSAGCARAAADLYGVPVSVGSLFAMPAQKRAVDFVILIGVLEHVEDLKGALDHVRHVLSPNGQVFAEVPDAAHLGARPDAPFQEFSIEHIEFFSKVSLANLFRATAFEPIFIDEAVRQQHENTLYPAAFGVFRKTTLASPLVRDEMTEPGLKLYIEESAALESRTRSLITNRVGSRPIIVWGTGTHTQRLLAIGAFNDIHVVAFVDSNPKYHVQDIRGVPVVSPSSLSSRREPILISTRGFQAEIQHQIRHELRLDNEVILLYERD